MASTTSSPPAIINVNVEYCSAWGYEPKYQRLKSELENHFKNNIRVNGGPGRRSSFEITIWLSKPGESSSSSSSTNKTLIYSKLKKGSFPSPNGILDAINTFAQTGNVIDIPAATGEGCIIA